MNEEPTADSGAAVAPAVQLLRDRIAAGETILIDGGTGTEIEALGVPMNSAAWCGLASLTHPDQVREVHEQYLDAGAEMLIANTYVCGRYILMDAGHGDDFEMLNTRGIELALEARANRDATDRVAVAGSIATTLQGRSLRELSEATIDYADQAQVQAAAGAEFFTLEMMRDLDYTRAAIDGVTKTGLPYWVGFSTEMRDGVPWLLEGTPEQGGTLAEGVQMLSGVDYAPDVVAIMHTEVDDIDACLDVIQAHWDGPVAVYAQTGRFERPHWIFTDTITPEAYADAALRWIDRGVQIVGGCCGISPSHIAHIHGRLTDFAADHTHDEQSQGA